MARAIKILELWQVSVRGVVQGVGFRPFVYQLAQKYNLKGWVCNTSGDVKIEVEGESDDLARFLIELRESPPPQAHIDDRTIVKKSAAGYKQFEIPADLQVFSPWFCSLSCL